MGIWRLESVQEEDVSLEEARRTISGLKERQKYLAKISHTWNAKYRHELRNVHCLRKEKDEHLKAIQSQLLVFETFLQKTKVEVENLVKHKDDVIRGQHQLICSLALALVKRKGLDDLRKILPGIKIEGDLLESYNSLKYDSESKNNSKNFEGSLKRKKDLVAKDSWKSDLESLNDSDSAIMMEDAYDSLIVFPSEKGEAKVMRSVSDALELISRGSSSINNKNNIVRNNNNQTSIRRNGSVSSSTPSGSSEESDSNSPSSTLSKGRFENSNGGSSDSWLISSKSNLNSPDFTSGLGLTLSFCNTTPPCRESDCISSSSSYSTDSCITNFPSLYISNSCQHGNNSSTCQYCCHSGSTTPLVSPAASPSSSRSTTPSASPIPALSSSTSLNTKYRHNYNNDSDATLSNGESEDEDEVVNLPAHFHKVSCERTSLFGSFEKLNLVGVSYVKKKPKHEINPVSYNRVMSNHRSVTKPKDVKYKRINKAKSRSLEELRGKLKLYDDGRQTFLIDSGQSEA